jgi:hypothetical protein
MAHNLTNRKAYRTYINQNHPKPIYQGIISQTICNAWWLSPTQYHKPNAMNHLGIIVFMGGIPTIPSHGRFMAARVAHITAFLATDNHYFNR